MGTLNYYHVGNVSCRVGTQVLGLVKYGGDYVIAVIEPFASRGFEERQFVTLQMHNNVLSNYKFCGMCDGLYLFEVLP